MLKTYKELIRTISDASEEYAESVALGILSGLSGRNILIRAMGSTILYPNLWIMLLGASGISRKTTVIRPARRVMLNIYPEMVFPDKMTEEAAFAYFDGRGVSQAMLIADEFAGTLANLDKQYAMGFKQLLMKLYDCIDYERRKIKSADETIRNAYLTILAGGTPYGIMKYLSDHDIESGFLPRFLLVYPPLPAPKRIPKRTLKAETLFRRVSAEAFILRLILKYTKIYSVFDDSAYEFVSNYFFEKEIDIRQEYTPIRGSVFSRELEYVFKIATLIALDEILEEATDHNLDTLQKDIKIRRDTNKKTDDKQKEDPTIYEEVMALTDKYNTGEKVALSLSLMIKRFGDMFDSSIPSDFKEYIHMHFLLSSKAPLDGYNSGLLMMLEGSDIPLRVTLDHVKQAIKYVEKCEKEYLHVSEEIMGGHEKQIANKVYAYIKKHGTVAHSIILRNLNLNKDQLRYAAQQLVEEERIKIVMVGRKKIYEVL